MVRILAVVLLAAVVSACAARAPHDATAMVACGGQPGRYWTLPPGSAQRSLRVWMDRGRQDLDGWGPYGARRLGFAMDAWNALRLPLRLTAASSARESDIVVDVIASIPPQRDGSDRDQAGITNLTFHASGEITRAHVFVAVSAPFGVRYPVQDQQANLVHELGHALGMLHAGGTSALMAPRRGSLALTGADLALARAHFTCPA